MFVQSLTTANLEASFIRSLTLQVGGEAAIEYLNHVKITIFTTRDDNVEGLDNDFDFLPDEVYAIAEAWEPNTSPIYCGYISLDREAFDHIGGGD